MSSGKAPQTLPSEDVLNRKMDLCLSNAIVKTGIGFSAGVVLSVLLLRRRAWPVWLGTGFGLGSAYTDCERSFNPVSVPGVRVVPASVATAGADTQYGHVQQRVGELAGAAKEQAKRVPGETEELRETAQSRFAELSESGKKALEHQVSELQDVAHTATEKIADLGREYLPSTSAKPAEGEKWRIHAPSEPHDALLHETCVSCRVTGAVALACVGAAACNEAYRVGAFHAARRTQPRWGFFLAAVGVASFAGAGARLAW
ncbi:Mitochondrial inner membrane organizing system component [Malassezia sp. CBS 17886]|nr:Mitochondrial inner membrane organizing system component [Malassezia sp. CBS 17886]